VHDAHNTHHQSMIHQTANVQCSGYEKGAQYTTGLCLTDQHM